MICSRSTEVKIFSACSAFSALTVYFNAEYAEIRRGRRENVVVSKTLLIFLRYPKIQH